MENTLINAFEQKHNKSAPVAVVHIGFHADEFARSFHALAVTIRTDIYFRKNAYNPGSEEGQKLLAHELTHVSQYAEKRITKITTKEELEEEAVKAEWKEEIVQDKMMTVEIGGERFRESQMDKVADKVADEMAFRIKQNKFRMQEKEYLAYLCAVDDWIKGR